ncbi:hypothetical protein [Lentibacillus cibarius]|uniref:Uncharacterized protein n=1 Tax=Lentibacillus cibarius TaxID=2583219 RepID=A0A5S3QKV5_9BACI|nr:hypothetical protein [Lentibacillus cibarius]TMN21841.1 hypothetical protein FFL34_06730 [Lentibacillus cibarius]
MGTYYALGIVKHFTAKSDQAISPAIWNVYLDERIDIQLYTLRMNGAEIHGELKMEVFEDNIEDFYNKLVEITDNEKISIYFEDSGKNMEQYQSWVTEMTVKQYDPNITLTAELAILFIEGKVLVEEFSIEPKLINWLFRHVNLANPLVGCVMCDIVG